MNFSRINDGKSALTLEQVRTLAPSVFAGTKHESRSEKYAFFPTIAPLVALLNEGFAPVKVMQTRTRIEGKQDFTKHQIRLRRVEDIQRAAVVGGTVKDVIMTNGHDGSSKWKFRLGCFRYICANGMVVGDSSTEFSVAHRGNEAEQIGKIIDAAYTVTGYFDKVDESMDMMQSVHLSEDVQVAMAETALTLKYGEGKDAPIGPRHILHTYREADKGDDLWRVFNRLQENLLNGGQYPQRTSGGRLPRRTRAVTGIDQYNKLNQQLWTLAETIAAALA